MSDFYQKTKTGLGLTVKAKPSTPRERALKVVDVGEGVLALEIAVKDAAQDGKANKALCEKVAACVKVKKNQVHLKAGPRSKLKKIEIEGDPEALLAELEKHLLEGVQGLVKGPCV
ncbi:MAG: DUF167 domain-containing protein [Bdellovibrionales bacterium]